MAEQFFCTNATQAFFICLANKSFFNVVTQKDATVVSTKKYDYTRKIIKYEVNLD